MNVVSSWGEGEGGGICESKVTKIDSEAKKKREEKEKRIKKNQSAEKVCLVL